MRLVIQRVKEASVSIDGKVVSTMVVIMRRLKLLLLIPFILQFYGCEKSEPTIPKDAVIARRIDKVMIDADDNRTISKEDNLQRIDRWEIGI